MRHSQVKDISNMIAQSFITIYTNTFIYLFDLCSVFCIIHFTQSINWLFVMQFITIFISITGVPLPFTPLLQNPPCTAASMAPQKRREMMWRNSVSLADYVIYSRPSSIVLSIYLDLIYIYIYYSPHYS